MGDGQMSLAIDEEMRGDLIVRRMVLPFLPPSKNVYDGWQPIWQSSAKKKWTRTIAEKADEMDLPRGLPKIGLAARLVFPSKQRRDPQNYAQTLWHWVPDALVRCGVILDDDEGKIEIGPNWGLEFAYDTRETLAKDARKRTVLTIAWRVP